MTKFANVYFAHITIYPHDIHKVFTVICSARLLRVDNAAMMCYTVLYVRLINPLPL